MENRHETAKPEQSQQGHASLAFQLLREGKLGQAQAVCEELVRSQPDSPKPLMLMSAILHRQGDFDGAVSLLAKASALEPDSVDTQLQLVMALRKMGALDDASRLLNTLDQQLPEVRLNHAQIEWQRGLYMEAIESFRSAAKAWPDHSAIHYALCRALIRAGQDSDAGPVLDRALDRWPHDPEFSRLLAVAHLDSGDSRQALSVLETCSYQAPQGSMAFRLYSALQRIQTGQFVGNSSQADPIDESFEWLLKRPQQPNWFGSNTGLLRWAIRQLPATLSNEFPVIECGVYHGFSLNLMAQWTDRPIIGFDSFEGLPEQWKPGEPAGSYSTSGKLPNTPAGVTLIEGWFDQTLPNFVTELETPIALLHVDCDIYSSTRTVLSFLAEKLAPGGMLVFDDFLSYAGYRDHEFRAAHEFFDATCGSYELAGAVLLGRSAAYRRLA